MFPQFKCKKSAPDRKSFPSESVEAFLHSHKSRHSWAPLWIKGHIIQQTSLKIFTVKEIPRRVTATRVRISNKLNRRQSLYRVSWEEGVWYFPGWLVIGGTYDLILEQTQMISSPQPRSWGQVLFKFFLGSDLRVEPGPGYFSWPFHPTVIISRFCSQTGGKNAQWLQ